MSKNIILIAMMIASVLAQNLTLINIIQFSDDYCLCPNEQHISVVGTCVPVLGGYSVYQLVEGNPDQVIVQLCTDKDCTQGCQNTTTYAARPPCQTETDGISYYSVLPENDATTYYNAPSVVTVRYPYKNCTGDALHVDIAYGLSCFPTQEGGSFYYECPEGTGQTEYNIYNCSDNACLVDCTPTSYPTETCTDDEGVFKSVYCTPSSTTSTTQTATSQTATSQTSTGQTANTINSATVSTTTSASSHNVSSSASAAAAGGSSATSGGSVRQQSALYSDVRGGHMSRKTTRNNPPFCNGGLPSTTATATAGNAASDTSNSGGSSSGGRGEKVLMTKN